MDAFLLGHGVNYKVQERYKIAQDLPQLFSYKKCLHQYDSFINYIYAKYRTPFEPKVLLKGLTMISLSNWRL